MRYQGKTRPGHAFAASVAGIAIVGITACSRDVRLTGKEIPTVTVKSVSYFGITLDESASPKQVVFAALRAIRDDFHAEDADARKQALAIQFDLCAANQIAARNVSSTSRDEFVYHIVNRWTPTVSHYVDDFDTDWAKAEPRLVQKPAPGSGDTAGTEYCSVLMEVRDPSGDPAAGVVLVAWLAKDSGFWRISHFGFDAGRRTIDGKIPPPLVQSLAAARPDAPSNP